MNILLATLIFNGYTGSEWYTYELARCLSLMKDEKGKPKNKVTIYSNTHPETSLIGKLRKLGVKFINYETTAISEKYDIVHYAHTPIGNYLLTQKSLYNSKFFSTIHSEIISLENPIINDRILKYISIRPSIRNHIETNFNIPPDKIIDIYNPIDETRFNTNDTSNEPYILFHGSLDFLRKDSFIDCVNYARNNNLKVVSVGRNDFSELNTTNFPDCEFKPATPDLLHYVKNCTMTAGILLGRSTIEGYFCGKSGIIYDVDERGKILSSNMTMQSGEELEKFKASYVTNKIYEVYNES